MNKLVVSQSPHLHSKNGVAKLMYYVILALLPTFVLSMWLYGIGALIVILVSVGASVAFEWLIVKYLLHQKPTILDGSAIITGLLLAFNIPSNLPVWIVVIGALVAIGIGKLSFGGLGQNIFNPALVGRVFMLISFPVQMTSWPKPNVNRTQYLDAVTGATPLGVVKEGLKNGEAMSSISDHIPSHLDLFYGLIGGAPGEISALLIILGGIFLIFKKVISWHIPVSVLATVFVMTGIIWFINPETTADPIFHLLTGGLMLGAFFMATDYATSPMSNIGKIIFGIGVGAITIIIRIWGAYPEGISFAILLMNATVPLINRQFKPRLFGKVKKIKNKK